MKESLTIDEDISKWIRCQTDHKSSSDFVNSVLREKMTMDKDIMAKITNYDYQICEITEKKHYLLKELERIFDEGTKQERERAEIKIKEEQEKNKKHLKRIALCYAQLKKLGFLNEIMQYEDDESLRIIAKEIYKKVVENGGKLKDCVGFLEIKEIKAMHEAIDFDKLLITVESEEQKNDAY